MPRWMKRPSCPGIWLCWPGMNGRREYTNGLCLTAEDIERGAPFETECVFGPIPEPDLTNLDATDEEVAEQEIVTR